MSTTARREVPVVRLPEPPGEESGGSPSAEEADAVYADAMAAARRAGRVAAALERLAGRFPGAAWDDAATAARRGEAALRRAAEAVPEIPSAADGERDGILDVGPLAIDRGRRIARYAGRPIALTRLEFDLLCALAEEAGRCVTKGELLRRVWRFQGGSARTRTVDSHASRVRRALVACGAPEATVRNVWAVGYRLVVPAGPPGCDAA